MYGLNCIDGAVTQFRECLKWVDSGSTPNPNISASCMSDSGQTLAVHLPESLLHRAIRNSLPKHPPDTVVDVTLLTHITAGRCGAGVDVGGGVMLVPRPGER